VPEDALGAAEAQIGEEVDDGDRDPGVTFFLGHGGKFGD
jgi:hypothetical protein